MGNKVSIYVDANFSGTSQELSEGSYDIAALQIGNDQISSLKVPSGFKVTLYEHAGFIGRTKVFTQDADWVGDDFNDMTSSIKVESSPRLNIIGAAYGLKDVTSLVTGLVN